MKNDNKRRICKTVAWTALFGIVLVCNKAIADPAKKDPISLRRIEKNVTVSGTINTGYGIAISDKWVVATETITTSDRDSTTIGAAGAKFRAPKITLLPGFTVPKGRNFTAGVPTFKVHFVSMVDPDTDYPPDGNPDISGIFGPDYNSSGNPMSQEQLDDFCKNEIAILNNYFKNENGGQLVRFEFKDAQPWDDAMLDTYYYRCMRPSTGICDDDDGIPTVESGLGWTHPGGVDDHASASDVYNLDLSDYPNLDESVFFTEFRDDSALNLNIFTRILIDPLNSNSSGKAHAHWYDTPRVDINYRRIDQNLWDFHDGSCINPDCGLAGLGIPSGGTNNFIQDDDHERGGVEPHEMGHAFGLNHVCDQEATTGSPFDNIMASNSIGDSNVYFVDPSGTYDCKQYCSPNCQDNPALRSGGFLLNKFGAEFDDGTNIYYKFQRYVFSGYYEETYYEYAQAETIMNFAEYYELFGEIE